jgi:hypothetical protein
VLFRSIRPELAGLPAVGKLIVRRPVLGRCGYVPALTLFSMVRSLSGRQ